MAEFVMKDLVKKAGLASQFHIESAATSREEIGNPVYPPARRKLAEHGISCDGHAARQLTNLNEARFSNIFIEKRASTCPQSLEKSRLFSYALLVSECENFQNMKRIFLRKVVI